MHVGEGRAEDVDMAGAENEGENSVSHVGEGDAGLTTIEPEEPERKTFLE